MSTLKVTNIKAADGTSALTIADSTGNVSVTGNFTSKGIDDNASSTALTIDGSGRVMMPYQPSFRVAGLTTTTSTANYIFVFPTVIHDTGNDYDNTTGKFTAPVDGVYHFSCQLYRGGTVDDASVLFMKNSVSETELRVETSSASSAGYAYLTLSITIELALYDTVWLQLRFGTVHANNNWSYLSGHLVG